MRDKWQGVTPCPHTHLYMHGTRECSECWVVRFDAWWDARWPDEDESLPFQEGAEEAREDYASDAAYADQG